MANERLAPDSAIISQTTFTESDTSNIDYDPDAPPSPITWALIGGNNVNGDMRVSFPTPSGNLNTGAGLQEFRVLIRQQSAGQTGTPTARLEVYETGDAAGSPHAASAEIDITSEDPGQVISLTWDATGLTSADGSGVECFIDITKSGGAPGARESCDIGGIEWNADYSSGTPRNVTGTTASVVVTPSSATVNRQRGVNTVAKAVVVTASAATVNRERGVNASSKAVTVAATSSINRTRGVTASSKAVSVAASATVNRTRTVSAGSKAIIVTPGAATVNAERIVSTTARSVIITPAAATVTRDRVVTAASKALIITANAATVTAVDVWSADGGQRCNGRRHHQRYCRHDQPHAGGSGQYQIDYPGCQCGDHHPQPGGNGKHGAGCYYGQRLDGQPRARCKYCH
jgi:hypothetical protein